MLPFVSPFYCNWKALFVLLGILGTFKMAVSKKRNKTLNVRQSSESSAFKIDDLLAILATKDSLKNHANCFFSFRNI